MDGLTTVAHISAEAEAAANCESPPAGCFGHIFNRKLGALNESNTKPYSGGEQAVSRCTPAQMTICAQSC